MNFNWTDGIRTLLVLVALISHLSSASAQVGTGDFTSTQQNAPTMNQPLAATINPNNFQPESIAQMQAIQNGGGSCKTDGQGYAICSAPNGDTQQIFDKNGAVLSGTNGQGSAEAAQAGQKCDKDFKTARPACDPMQAMGLNQGESQLVQMALQGAQMALSQSCSTAAKVLQGLTFLQGIRASGCGGAMEMCIGSCKKAYEAAKAGSTEEERFTEQLRSCIGYRESYALQMMQMKNTFGQMLQSKDCKKQATNNAPNTGTAPTLPSTQVNCADPNQKRTNPLCICADNPNAPSCNPFASTNRPPGSGSITDNSTGGGAYNPGLGDGGSGEDGLYSGSSAANGNANKVQEIGGGGGGVGGGSSGGGSGGGGSGAGAGDPAAQGYKTDMASGGGAGGGGFSGYGKGKGGEGEGSSALSKLKGLFNIKDALPDKDKMARGLAGMSKEAQADGITGAMGETLFQKASRQYKNQESRGGLIVPKQ